MTDELRARAYAMTFVLSTVLFAALAAAVLFWERAARLDVRFVTWVHTTVPDAVVDAMQVLTYAGSVVILGLLTILAGFAFVRRGRPGAALFVVAALIGSQLLDQALKAGFRRTRPELDEPFVQLTTYAFPSGHAFGATATYGALALVLASAATHRRRRVAVLVVAAALIAVVAASRVILGVHYLLDVAAGVVAGIAWISALLLVLQRTRRFSLRAVPFPGQEQPQRSGLDA
jgi:membrane-associated phospholipid phosphatase